MHELEGYIGVIIGTFAIISSVGSHYLRQGKQDSINEQNEKRFTKIEEKAENSDLKLLEFVKEIRGEFKEIQKNQQDAQKSLSDFAHSVELSLTKVASEMGKQSFELEKHGNLRQDFINILGVENINKLRKDQTKP